MAFVGYPPELEATQWEKNKGVIAKITTETGIGKALTDLKDTYKALNQEKLGAGGYGKMFSVQQIDDAFKQAKDLYTAKVVPLRNKALAVSKLATDTGAKFKANKLIPKSSTEYVLKVANAASTMATAFKSLDSEFASFEAAKKRLVELHDMQRNMIVKSLSELEAGVKVCLSKPSAESWVKNVRQKNRSVGNALGNVEEYKKQFWGVWQPLDGLQVNEKDTPEKVKQECNKLLGEIPKVRAVVTK